MLKMVQMLRVKWKAMTIMAQTMVGMTTTKASKAPLISRQSTSVEGTPHGSLNIGGGWQLAWKWTEREGADGQKEGGFQRVYLHEHVSLSRLQLS
jgi:hypothetical protein